MTDPRIIAHCVLMLAGAAASTTAMGQVMAPSAAASAAAERAQKETDRTMYWIRVLAATPAAKPAPAPRPVAAAPAPQPRPAAAPERVRVAAAPAPAPAPAPVPAQTSVDVANAAPSAVVVAAPPAAVAPTLAPMGNGSATASGSLDAGVASAGLAGSLAAPSVAATQVDVPVVEEEPDPGLIMTKSADPDFPMAAMRRLRKGSVEVKFEVGADGVVNVVNVVKTSNAGLNSAAIEAVRQWRFKPTPKSHTAMVDLAFDLDS